MKFLNILYPLPYLRKKNLNADRKTDEHGVIIIPSQKKVNKILYLVIYKYSKKLYIKDFIKELAILY